MLLTQKRKKFINTILLGLAGLLTLASLNNLGPGSPPPVTVSNQQYLQITWGHWKENKPWEGDQECGELRTRIARVGSLPTRALASYPGSGNTWIRYLIEGASGIFTGSVFNDKSIDNAGHHGETRNFKDGSTILQKTHHRTIINSQYATFSLAWRQEHINMFGGRGVVVVRNPFKAVLSYWNYVSTQSHTKSVDVASLKTSKFKDFAFVGISRWFELIDDWIQYGRQVYFVFYEDLTDDPVGEIGRLMEHLRIEPDQERFKCIESHLKGSFKRPNHTEENPFSEDQKSLFRAVIDVASQRIAGLTGRPLPVHKYAFYNSVEPEP